MEIAKSKPEIFKIGSFDDVIQIINGPTDWDLWLCLRKTKFFISFSLDRAIIIPPFTNSATFFSGTINSMEATGKDLEQKMSWNLKGRVYKANMITCFVFEALYNTETKKGQIIFKTQ